MPSSATARGGSTRFTVPTHSTSHDDKSSPRDRGSVVKLEQKMSWSDSSARSDPIDAGSADSREHSLRSRARRFSRRPSAVSYTHLTLPTTD